MEISKIKSEMIEIINQSEDINSLERLRPKLLGKNSRINILMKSIGSLNKEQRKQRGILLNSLRKEIELHYLGKIKILKNRNLKKKLTSDSIDVTLPGRSSNLGSIHPITSTIFEISEFFTSIGFTIASGPEAETDYYNFEALNIPEKHPAKDMHDTFYLENGFLLRTHTSPVQVRTMEKQKPPIRIICPGRVYRKDSDLTHTPMYHNIEGLVIEEGASFAVLKGLLKDFIVYFFGKNVELRFRPSYFPFTEPSAEVDIKWKKGWLEILGCGMVHPNVLKMSGIDPNKHNGFAFGLGPERMAMLKHNIPDLRAFFENDIRFLKQF